MDTDIRIPHALREYFYGTPRIIRPQFHDGIIEQMTKLIFIGISL